MNKVINQHSSERGITLIALIVMIIIIVILGAVTISNIAGSHNLIDVTTEVANNYEVASYKEQIEQVVYSTIISYSARGEVPTLIDMANALNEQEWVRTAVANTDTSISNGDIIVVVDKGYIFQVYYDSINGKIKIDYIGKTPGGGTGDTGNIEDIINSLPTVKARYEENSKSIIVEASEPKNGIEKIEIIYQNEIIATKTNPGTQEKFDVSKYGSGWYQVKATAKNTGSYRYAWVKVSNISSKLAMPSIKLAPSEADGKNGWYKQAVNVTMTVESELVKEIHYRVLRNGVTKEEEEDILYTESFTIDTTGITRIYAWTTDGEKEQSAEKEEVIKIDNVPPQIISAVIEGTEGENRWIISSAEIRIEATDNTGGTVEGYRYEVYNMDNILQKKSNGVISIEKTIPVETDGEWKVIIKAIDEAGNESAEKYVEVHKDTVPPTVDTPIISNIKGASFRIEAVGGDDTSGVAKYEYYIDGTKYTENTTGVCNVTGRKPNTSYTVSAKVYDNAGLSKMSNNRPAVTDGSLEAPNIIPSGTTINGYYKGTITVTIQDATGIATRIKYKINSGEEQTINGTSGNFTITEDGTHIIEAWIEDNSGNKSETCTSTMVKDTIGPTVNLEVGTVTKNTIPVTATAKDTVSRNSKLYICI